MARLSTAFFLLSAFLFFISGLLCFSSTVQPGPDPVVNLSTTELLFFGSCFNNLNATLLKIIGINLIVLALLTVYIGTEAWQDSFAWITGLLYLLIYALPLTILTVLSNGKFLLAVLPVILYAFGLILALTTYRKW